MANVLPATTLSGRDFMAIMLETGRMSQWDYDVLRRALYKEGQELFLDGNVKISVSLRAIEAGHQVFNTEELLELILSFLSAFDQLHVRAVCKAFSATIDSSPGIRTKMARKASGGSSVTLAPYHVRGFHGRVTQARGRPGISFEIRRSSFLSTYRQYLRHSSLLRSLYLAQPPPAAVVLSRYCYCYEPTQIRVQSSRDGVTFGDVFLAIDRMRLRCAECKTFTRLFIYGRYTNPDV
jgi:hypothetical protein